MTISKGEAERLLSRRGILKAYPDGAEEIAGIVAGRRVKLIVEADREEYYAEVGEVVRGGGKATVWFKKLAPLEEAEEWLRENADPAIDEFRER